jgi:hypothetical protein
MTVWVYVDKAAAASATMTSGLFPRPESVQGVSDDDAGAENYQKNAIASNMGDPAGLIE